MLKVNITRLQQSTLDALLLNEEQRCIQQRNVYRSVDDEDGVTRYRARLQYIGELRETLRSARHERTNHEDPD